MRIFATNQFIIDLKESSGNTGLYGVSVATSDFYKNLLRFGKFDEYYFFTQSEHSHRKKDDFGRGKSRPGVFGDRLKFRKIDRLASFLKDTRDFVFFVSTPAIFNMVHLRNVYAKRYFPICGLTHTISYGRFFSGLFFQNVISDLQPFDTIICTSRSVLDSLKKTHTVIKKDALRRLSMKISFKPRLEFLPLGINAEDYAKNDKGESRRKLNLPVQKIIILYFGRFSIYDKADLYPLIYVFKHLLAKNKDILLVLAGKNFQDDYGSKLKKIARDLGVLPNIRFFFNPSRAEKYLLYAASDIFVSPSDSLQESFGLTVLEAMAAGLGVVVSDWDGYRDMVIHNDTGLLVPTYWTNCDREIANSSYLFGNSDLREQFALAQSICVDGKKMIQYLSLLIKRRDLRLKFGNKARERVLNYYDWSALIPRYERLWDRLIREAKSYKASPRRLPVFYPRYSTCFKHYPTQILNKQTHIVMTEEGKRLLTTRKFLSQVLPLNLILPKIVLLILLYLKGRRTFSIERVRGHIHSLFKESSSAQIDYHIMWMLKHYLVEAVSIWK